jgi:arylsulfatase A-like enzyme
MYYPSIIPHAELVAPKEYMNKYLGKYEPEKEYQGNDGGDNYRMGGYESQKNSHAAFVAMIHLLDDQVGDIVAKVKELGIEENTLIIFTSDNGPHKEGGADPDYFDSNGIFRGYKRDLYEGGIRVPMIAKWKGKIKSGSTSDHISAFWDIFPTVAEMVDHKVEENIDGISLLPTLLGKGDQKKHGHLYWEFHERGGRQAIRQGDWKLVKYNVNKNGKYQLYNLKIDPGETNDIASQHDSKLAELVEILESSRTESEVYSFIRK